MVVSSGTVAGGASGRKSQGFVWIWSLLDASLRPVLLCLVIGDFVSFIVKQWHVLSGAWAIFATAVVVVGVLVYLACERLNKAAIQGRDATINSQKEKNDILAERLKTRDEQNAELKAKVGTESPDEIKARIDRLEAQLALLVPRRLGEDRMAQLVAALKSTVGYVDVVQDMAVAEAVTLARELAHAFSTAGWTVRTPMVMGPSNLPAHGLGVRVEDPSALTSKQATIVAAFKAVGLQFDLQTGRMGPPHPAPRAVLSEPEPDAEVFVTQRIQ